MRQLNISQNSWVALLVITLVAIFGFLGAFTSITLISSNVTGPTASFSGLVQVDNEYGMLRCAEGEVVKMQALGFYACDQDETASVTGAGVVVLDLDDDSSNESAALGEIATTGCSGSAFAQTFTEPSADKLLVTCNQPAFTDISGSVTDGQVPNNITIDLAATATALAANGTNCAANQFNKGVDASGNAESCAALIDADVPDTITINNAATADALTSNPSDCAADTKADAIDAAGNLTCTNVDTGDIADGTILPADLDDGADTPGDEECLTYESTGPVFEWQSCGAGSQNLFETISTTSGTSPVADSPTDTLTIAAGTGMTVTGDAGTDTVTIATTVTDTNANTLCSGTTTYLDGDGNCDDIDPVYANVSGDTFTGTLTVTGSANLVLNLDCSGFANGGTLSVTGSGVVHCQDDNSASGSGINVEENNVLVTSNPTAIDFQDPFDCITDGTETDCDIDFTEVGDTTFGSGSDFTWTFDSLGTVVMRFFSSVLSLAQHLLLDNESELRLGEADGNGSNYIAVKAPAAVTSNQTCTLEDDATPFDSCVTANDGVGYDTIQDAGSSLTQRATLNMTGSGVSCADTGAITECTITDTNTDNQNLFETFTPDLGDPIVADSATDTATITSLQGTIAITGTAASDTLDFDAINVNCTGCLTTTQVSGLDISDDTNLAAGRSLTLTGDSVEADAELFTVKKSIVILNPTTAETNLAQYEYATAATITEVSCSTNTGTVTIQLDERARATPNSAGTNVMTSSLVCDSDSETTTSFTNAGIAADVPVNLQITATASTPGVVRIHIEATKDD